MDVRSVLLGFFGALSRSGGQDLFYGAFAKEGVHCLILLYRKNLGLSLG